MRRILLISGLAVVGLTIGGSVLAARRTDCFALPLARDQLASLQPVEQWPLAAGRIVAVDEKAGTLTVAHGAVKRFNLDPATRVLPVTDKTMLTGLTRGDKIRFDLAGERGRYAINRLEHSN